MRMSNVCLGRTDDSDLKLIDFGSARFLDSERATPIRHPYEYVHEELTPWQLHGFKYARRDDIFKSITVAAEMMLGWPYRRFILSLLQTGPESLHDWKNEFFIFSTPSFDPIQNDASLSLISARNVKERLTSALGLVRALNEVSHPIPYSALAAELHFAATILRNAVSGMKGMADSQMKSPAVTVDTVLL